MAQKDEDLKAQMMAQAEAAIEALLAKRAKKSRLDLSDIEDLTQEAGRRVTRELAAKLASEEAVEEQMSDCPECGQKLAYQGKRKRNLVTESGEVRLERDYYYCPNCRKGVFPPGPSLGTEQDEL